MTNDNLQAQLDLLDDLTDKPEARSIIERLRAELWERPDEHELETALADALHALRQCVSYIEKGGGNPPFLHEARAILEEARGEA